MTTKELIRSLDQFDGAAEVKIEALKRDENSGELVTNIIGTVDTVTHNGRGTVVYISTWIKG